MREYKIREGSRYEGTHIVYDHPEEFKKHNKTKKLFVWNESNIKDLEIGDWVVAEDGFVTQCLNIRKQIDQYRTCYFIRFPMGTFVVYLGKKGFKYYRFYAMFTSPDKNSISNRSRAHRSNNHLKLRFASMVSGGAEPIKAYLIAFNVKNTLTWEQLNRKVTHLFMDEVVQGELKSAMQQFKQDISAEITIADLLKKIKSYWDNVKPGSAQEFRAIQLAMRAHNVNIEEKQPAQKKLTKSEARKIQEAEYTDDTPPLGQ